MKDENNNNFILDASVTLAWFFSDEATPATNQLLDQLLTSTAFVPNIWPLEVSNILVGAEKRKKVTYANIIQFLDQLEKLNIQIDNETSKLAFHDILSLAHSEELTTYDAAYLELAMRKGLSIASKDKLLCKAAKNVGVKVIDL